jgi:hypothetical protein
MLTLHVADDPAMVALTDACSLIELAIVNVVVFSSSTLALTVHSTAPPVGTGVVNLIVNEKTSLPVVGTIAAAAAANTLSSATTRSGLASALEF